MTTGTRVLLVVLGLAVVVGGITFVNRTDKGEQGLVRKVKRAKSPVRVEVARPADMVETVSHTDALQAARDVMITAEVGGKVLSVAMDLGDRCTKDEVLLTLDAESYRIGLMQAEAGLAQAKAQAAQAQRDIARAEALVKRSTAAAVTLEQAKTGGLTAAAAVKQAEAAVKSARRNLRLTRVRCPFSGVVGERSVELGQMVGPQTPLFRLLDASSLKLTLKVPAADLARIEEGQAVELSDPTMAGRVFSGEVTRLGVAADRITHTFPVEVTVEATAGKSGPYSGQVLKASITLAEHKNALSVPEVAVVRTGDGPKLVLDNNGAATYVPVTLGPRIGQRVVVASGITAGDKVIVLGHAGLKPGSKVEDVSTLSTAGDAPPSKPSPPTTSKKSRAISGG